MEGNHSFNVQDVNEHGQLPKIVKRASAYTSTINSMTSPSSRFSLEENKAGKLLHEFSNNDFDWSKQKAEDSCFHK